MVRRQRDGMMRGLVGGDVGVGDEGGEGLEREKNGGSSDINSLFLIVQLGQECRREIGGMARGRRDIAV